MSSAKHPTSAAINEWKYQSTAHRHPSQEMNQHILNNVNGGTLRRLQQEHKNNLEPRSVVVRDTVTATPTPLPVVPTAASVTTSSGLSALHTDAVLDMHAGRWEDFTVCPPEWNMTPTQYRVAISNTSPGLSIFHILLGLPLFVCTLMSGGLVAGMVIHDRSVSESGGWTMLLMPALAVLLAGMLAAFTRHRKNAQARMLPLDPRLAVVLKNEGDRRTIRALAEPLADPDVSPETRARVLGDMYAEATRLVANRQSTRTDPATAAALELAEARRRWQQTLDRFATIDLAWADLLIDPLAVLEHSQLLDVSNPATKTLIETHGHARDLIGARTIADLPSDGTLDRTETAVRALETAWSDAHTRAERAGYAWLPEADQKRARQAVALLATADDEDGTPEEVRAQALAKAIELLKAITTVPVPTPVIVALTARATPMLNAAGPILTPSTTPDAVVMCGPDSNTATPIHYGP